MITSKNVGAANNLILGGAAAVDLGLTNPQVFSNGTDAQTLSANDVAGQITAQAGTYLNAKSSAET